MVGPGQFYNWIQNIKIRILVFVGSLCDHFSRIHFIRCRRFTYIHAKRATRALREDTFSTFASSQYWLDSSNRSTFKLAIRIWAQYVQPIQSWGVQFDRARNSTLQFPRKNKNLAYVCNLQVGLHTEKSFRNIIKSNRNQIVLPFSDWFGSANGHCPFGSKSIGKW